VLGTLFVIIGFIGIFLPVLPTTPFLLLAAILYARSSKKFYHWLLNNKIFRKYVTNYKEKRGITIKSKIITLSLLWITISISALIFVSNIFMKAGLFLIAIMVTIHILWIKTLKSDD
jgi:hypothetical protein